MKKRPIKQIYLLSVLIVGIIAASIYSTYAIFTLRGETNDIVSIHTPNSLKIVSESDEYRQVIIPKDSYITTDIDIYNTYEYDLCYSIWYKIANKSIEESKIQIMEVTPNEMYSSNIISTMQSRRISLLLINDNDSDAKVNIGLSYFRNQETCSLAMSKDKLLVTNSITNYQKISTYLKEQNNKNINNLSGYLTYPNQNNKISIPEKINISKNYTYKDELFTLTNFEEVSSNDLETYLNDEDIFYTCLTSSTCLNMYQIKKESITNEDDKYYLNNYTLLQGYLEGPSGIKKVTNNNIDNYVYYGDNPHNFIYYNCSNEKDLSTCELWRIIGTYYDKSTKEYLTKIIKNMPLQSSKYSDNLEDNLYSLSKINNYLNKEYKYNNNLTKEITYQEPYLKNNELLYSDKEITTKVNILSITDYLNSSSCNNINITNATESCLKNNYLNIGNRKEWTNTIKYMSINQTPEEEEKEEIKMLHTAYAVSNTIEDYSLDNEFLIRPVLYLKSRILITSGDGTLENPYIIK